MNKGKQGEMVRHAVDMSLSGLQGDPWLAQRILANVKGEVKVKKKLSVGLVLVLILVLVAVTALAAALGGYLDGFAKLEDAYGEYEQWPGSAKMELVKLMLDNDVLNQADAAQWKDDLTSEEKENVADKILTSYFSGIVHVDTYGIMMQELGQFEMWPLEEKALYTSLLEQYRRQKGDWPRYLLPEQSDMQEDEVIHRAISVLSTKFGVADEILHSSCVNIAFVLLAEEGDSPIWTIDFYQPVRYTGTYSIRLSRAGEALSWKAPDTMPYDGIDDLLLGATFVLPGPNDVTEEQAIAKIRESLLEIGYNTQETVAAMDAKAYFIYHERFNYGFAPVWLIYMLEGENLKYKGLIGYNGTYMDIVPGDMDFTNTHLTDENFGDAYGVKFHETGFWEGSVAEKAAFSRKWRPLVNDFLSKHPYYVNQGDFFYFATRYVYGEPSHDDLSQEAAVQLALNAIVPLGASEQTLSNRRIEYYFDVTDPERPLWKLIIFQADTDRAIYVKDNNSARFRVILDSKRGEILEAWKIPGDMPISEWRF